MHHFLWWRAEELWILIQVPHKTRCQVARHNTQNFQVVLQLLAVWLAACVVAARDLDFAGNGAHCLQRAPQRHHRHRGLVRERVYAGCKKCYPVCLLPIIAVAPRTRGEDTFVLRLLCNTQSDVQGTWGGERGGPPNTKQRYNVMRVKYGLKRVISVEVPDRETEAGLSQTPSQESAVALLQRNTTNQQVKSPGAFFAQ